MGDKIALYGQAAPAVLVGRSWSRVVLLLAMGSFVVGVDLGSGGLSPAGAGVALVVLAAAGGFAWESLKMGSRRIPMLWVSERNGELVFARPATWRIGVLGRFRVGEPMTLLHRREWGSPIRRWRLRKDRYRVVQEGGTIAWASPTALTETSLADLERFLTVWGCELTVAEEPPDGILMKALDDPVPPRLPWVAPEDAPLVAFRPRPGRPVVATIPAPSGEATFLPLGSDNRTAPDGRELLSHADAVDHMVTIKAPGSDSIRVTVAFEAPANKPLHSEHDFGKWSDQLAFIDGDTDNPAQIYSDVLVCGAEVYADPATPSDVVIRLRATQ